MAVCNGVPLMTEKEIESGTAKSAAKRLTHCEMVLISLWLSIKS